MKEETYIYTLPLPLPIARQQQQQQQKKKEKVVRLNNDNKEICLEEKKSKDPVKVLLPHENKVQDEFDEDLIDLQEDLTILDHVEDTLVTL